MGWRTLAQSASSVEIHPITIDLRGAYIGMGTIRYAIIGCGVVARKHLKGARYHQNKRRTLEIVAAVDTRPGAAEKIFAAAGFNAKEIARLAIYEDYQKMLSEVRPDLVVITTPSGSHASISLAALAAGAHVLIEKPLTLSLEQADEILEVARKATERWPWAIFTVSSLWCRLFGPISCQAVLAKCSMVMSKCAGAMHRRIMTRLPGAEHGLRMAVP